MSKIREAFLIYAQPEKYEEYIRRHNPIWPDLKKELKKYGISNYSIFMHENKKYLFGYFEIKNKRLYERMGDSEVCRKWWKHMTEVLICNAESDEKAKEDILTEVFYLE